MLTRTRPDLRALEPRTTDGTRLIPVETHVLLLEDDSDLRDGLREILESDGHRVTAFGDGGDARAYFSDCLHQDPPRKVVDCIVSDLRVPGCSGLELVAFIEDEGCFIPTVLVTAFGSASTWLQAQRLGVFSVLDKPVREIELLRAVRRAVGRSSC